MFTFSILFPALSGMSPKLVSRSCHAILFLKCYLGLCRYNFNRECVFQVQIEICQNSIVSIDFSFSARKQNSIAKWSFCTFKIQSHIFQNSIAKCLKIQSHFFVCLMVFWHVCCFAHMCTWFTHACTNIHVCVWLCVTYGSWGYPALQQHRSTSNHWGFPAYEMTKALGLSSPARSQVKFKALGLSSPGCMFFTTSSFPASQHHPLWGWVGHSRASGSRVQISAAPFQAAWCHLFPLQRLQRSWCTCSCNSQDRNTK